MPCTRTHSLPRSTIASLLVGLVVLCAAPGAHAQRVATGRIKIGVDSGGGGGGGGPANPANSVQFNNGGAFGGSANLTFNPGTGILTTNEVSPLTDASFSLGEIALNWTKVFTAAIQNGVSGDATGIAVNDSLGMVATSWYEHTHGSLVLTNPASAQALTGGHIDISTAGNTSWSIPETGARDGQWTVVCNTSAFNVTLVNQAGIYIGSCVMAQNQCASMFYSNSQWQQLTCDGDIAPGPAPTNGAVQFNNGGLFGGDAATFFWDNTSKFLGIGTNTPADPINIFGGPAFQGGLRVNGPVDGVRQILLDNPSAGTSALASLVVANDISSSHRVLFEYLGTNFTPVGLRTGQQGSLLSTGSGGMIIGTFPAGGSAAGDVIFVRGGTSAVNQRINLASTETSINTNQQVVNFRVASVAGANGIFVDGTSGLVGIGTNVPTTALTVAGTITPLTNATSSLGTSALNWTTSFAAAIQNGTSGDATGIAVNDSLGMVATSWYEHTHGSIVLTNPASAQALTGGHINVSEAGDTSWSIPETSARDGQWTVVCNTSAFNVTLVPQAGIYVGSCVMAQNQCASMIYSNSQWTQLTCDGDIAPGPALSITTGTNQNLQLVANGTGVIQLNDAVTVGGDMTPDGDSTRQLGSGALHWLRLFVTNLQGNGGIVTVEADLDPDGNGTRALGIVSTQEWLSLATATVKTNFTKGLDLTSQNANGDVTATSARNIILDTPSANFVTIGTGSHANELRPAQDLAQALGDSTHRWANIFTGGIVTARVAVSCPNNGGGTPSTLTLQPQNAGVIEITNNDPDGCVVTVSETAATLGLQTRIIVVASAGGFTTFASQANVLALSGAFAMQIADSLVIEYANTADPEYIENSRSNN